MDYEIKSIPFTKAMDSEYTILIPNMLSVHFTFLKNVLEQDGHKIVLLKNEGRAVIDKGLKYVHNDTCYPALCVIGQFIDALDSGKHDVNKTAVMITQTGGGCRASNYLPLLRKALEKAGYAQVPVVSFNLAGLEKDSGFKITMALARKAIAAVVYGDILMLLHNQTRPYEVNVGDSQKMLDYWVEELTKQFSVLKGCRKKEIVANMKKIVKAFDEIPTEERDVVKVGIVGEIYVKYSSLANNNLEDFLFEQGCEVNVPGLLGFLMYMVGDIPQEVTLYGGNTLIKAIAMKVNDYLKGIEAMLIEAVGNSKRFTPPMPHEKMRALGGEVISHGCNMGEGWVLTAEMMELIHHGFSNIICAQPFGCLPNHIVGKGMIRKIKNMSPESNIVPIDYDPGATKVNQENRIKLMLAVARENKNKLATENKNRAAI